MTVLIVSAESEGMPATDTTVYTAPSTVKWAQIVSGTCANVTTATTLTVNVVQSGGSVAATNEYIPTVTINQDDSNPLDELIGTPLMPGDFVSVIAGDATRLNFKIGVKEVS